jgi:hypothetical protein
MMAYLAFDFGDRPGATEAPLRSPFTRDAVRQFTPLEWQVIRFAAHDDVASLHAASRLRRITHLLFGVRVANPLADVRLETLRRAAVHLWHSNHALDGAQIDALRVEGYSFQQIASLSAHIAEQRR